jgi:glycosyltransferase involved in cell wall biosynthesis
MMRVTFVLPGGMRLGGVTTWSLQMANVLVARGVEVNLLEHVNPQAAQSELMDPRVQLIQQAGQAPVFARRADVKKYRAAYQHTLPGIIIPNFDSGTYAACALLSKQYAAQMRVIAFAHTDDKFYYDLLDYYEPICQCFVAVSREVAQQLTQRIPHRAADIVTRPYGVRVPTVLERSWTPASQSIKLLYAGRLIETQKRISDLVRLASLLTAKGVDFQLDIAGEGRDQQELISAIATLDLTTQNRIRLLGRIPHAAMHQTWLSADLCLVVSEYEGTCLAMLEAMAAGCVPVVTEVSGAREAIQPGQNGYLLEVGDMEGMAQTIQRLAADRARLARLGSNAHQTIQAHFSLDSYVDWFCGMADAVEQQATRSWPRGKRVVLPRPTLNQRVRHWGKRSLQRVFTFINMKSGREHSIRKDHLRY